MWWTWSENPDADHIYKQSITWQFTASLWTMTALTSSEPHYCPSNVSWWSTLPIWRATKPCAVILLISFKWSKIWCKVCVCSHISLIYFYVRRTDHDRRCGKQGTIPPVRAYSSSAWMKSGNQVHPLSTGLSCFHRCDHASDGWLHRLPLNVGWADVMKNKSHFTSQMSHLLIILCEWVTET